MKTDKKSVENLKNKYIGSSFDDFLVDEDLLAESEAIAFKNIFSWELQKAMKEQDLTKMEAAKKMKTSRMAFDRLLDPNNTSTTLKSLERAAVSLGKRIYIEIRDAV